MSSVTTTGILGSETVFLRYSLNIIGTERHQSLQSTVPTTTLCEEIHKAPHPLKFCLTQGGHMTFKIAKEHVQAVSIIPKASCLQQESSGSEMMQMKQLGLGQWLFLSPPHMPNLLSLLLLFFVPSTSKRKTPNLSIQYVLTSDKLALHRISSCQ